LADRALLIELFRAGLAAVDPANSVRRAVDVHEGVLRCGELRFNLSGDGRIAVVAAGKASAAMATGFVDVVGQQVDGFSVVPHPAESPLPLLVAGHPLADARSQIAGERALGLASSLASGDLLVVLLSGGASALLAAPREEMTVDEIADITHELLIAGADITELNTVRRGLSRLKGGGLAAATEADVLTLALSDVVGDEPSVIGSGPTVPNPTGPADVRRILGDRGVALSEAVERALAQTAPIDQVPGLRTYVVVGNGAGAAAAVRSAAEVHGLAARVLDTRLEGEARHAALKALERANGHRGLSVFSGETTVTVTGDGLGGRNQEAALAAALAIEGSATSFLAAGTDGIDGPTEAAGAIVDGGSRRRIRAVGIDPEESLERNDAHRALVASGDVFVTGPTGTNVGDLWLIFVPD
jgi:hydroxypyruvate reductase